MTDRKPKRPRDPNQLARTIVDLATGEVGSEQQKKPQPRTNRSKGGDARSRVLSAAERKEIAKKAANARWKKDRSAREQTE